MSVRFDRTSSLMPGRYKSYVRIRGFPETELYLRDPIHDFATGAVYCGGADKDYIRVPELGVGGFKCKC